MTHDQADSDRGKPCRIWYSEGGCYSFNWFPYPDGTLAVSVPIGWAMVPDPDHGAILRSTYGRSANPCEVVRMARDGERGFRVIRGGE